MLAESTSDGRMGNDALGVGREDKLTGQMAIAHSACAHPVDREQGARAGHVDDSDREGARHLLQAVGAVLSIGLNERDGGTSLDRQRTEARRPPADPSFHRSQQGFFSMQRDRANSRLDGQGAAVVEEGRWRSSFSVAQCAAHAVRDSLCLSGLRPAVDPAANPAHEARPRNRAATTLTTER